MKRNIIITDGYFAEKDNFEKHKNIKNSTYELNMDGKTEAGGWKLSFAPTLSEDVNIFNELPEDVYKNVDARKFLGALRKALLSSNLDGITLSKLRVSEYSSTELVIDWIFNYFRIYFSFDSEGSDFYGIISNNPENGTFSNDFMMLDSEQYEILAMRIINYVIMMIHA